MKGPIRIVEAVETIERIRQGLGTTSAATTPMFHSAEILAQYVRETLSGEMGKRELEKLRDEFAAAALTGIIMSNKNFAQWMNDRAEYCAADSYAYADAMLKARVVK